MNPDVAGSALLSGQVDAAVYVNCLWFFTGCLCSLYMCGCTQYDYVVKVVYDGVRGSSKPAHYAALDAIKYLQANSETCAADVINALQKEYV